MKTRIVVAVALLAASCSGTSTHRASPSPSPAATTEAPSPTPKPQPVSTALPGMPPVTNPHNVYADAGAGMLSAAVRGQRQLIYVPNLGSNTVSVIDPHTYRVIDTFPVGGGPQHVVPAYDLQTLWVNNDIGNSLTPINPRTGRPGPPVPVTDPYNLYFTPDGKYAIVMAERLRRIDFRDPHSMALRHTLHVSDCKGVNHADFSADGRYFVATCEFNSRLIKVDTERQAVVGEIQLSSLAKPQDVKLSPDGKVFYIADMVANGVWEVTGSPFKTIGFIPTGRGTHGLYPSRTRGTSTRPTAARDRCRSSASPRERSSRPGDCRAAAAPTWGTSRPTARCSGCPGATTASSTPSTRETGI